MCHILARLRGWFNGYVVTPGTAHEVWFRENTEVIRDWSIVGGLGKSVRWSPARGVPHQTHYCFTDQSITFDMSHALKFHPKRSTSFPLMRLPLLIVTALVAAVPALAHSWYPLACCGNMDCFPNVGLHLSILSPVFRPSTLATTFSCAGCARALRDATKSNRRTPMIRNRVSAIALTAASATICSTPSAIAAPFDGNWSVVAQTTRGIAEASSLAPQ